MQTGKRGERGWIAAAGGTWLVLSTACVGRIGDDLSHSAAPPADSTEVESDAVSTSGLRRLTVAEYTSTVKDLLGDDGLPVLEMLPTDARSPFDNDYDQQVASQGLIDAADFIAELAADRLVADVARRDAIVGCAPTGPGDEACLTSFVASFGRRALRRSLTAAEIDPFVHGVGGEEGNLAHAIEAGDFWVAVHDVVWGMLEDTAFLYRAEIGAPVEGKPGLYRLSGVEVASRLSYFVWGSMPDDALLARAEAGHLETADERRGEALRMLHDARARDRIDRFHSMWLGYELMPIGGQLGADMRAETRALVGRVVFDQNLPLKELFLSEETFVSDLLADHYGLGQPGSRGGGWVSYADSPGGFGRAGILSHGSFLSSGAKFDDTSPVKRGRMVRERLLCQDIPDPPPNVNIDKPPTPKDAVCKKDRFAGHSQGGCASCHKLMDPVGFGLERYDRFGAFRMTEADNPSTEADESKCAIDGAGELEIGKFSGPAELAELLVDSGTVTACATTQLYRFVTGHSKLDDADRHVVELVGDAVGDADFTFEDLVLAVVAHPSFAHRRQE